MQSNFIEITLLDGCTLVNCFIFSENLFLRTPLEVCFECNLSDNNRGVFRTLSSIYNGVSPRKKCPYSELFWSAFSRIRTEYGEIRSISPYSVCMRENADQNNSEYRNFSRSVCYVFIFAKKLPHRKLIGS